MKTEVKIIKACQYIRNKMCKYFFMIFAQTTFAIFVYKSLFIIKQTNVWFGYSNKLSKIVMKSTYQK